ncbi:MAG: chemotaxis protein CheW [Spirochaetales bacterium]
MSDYLDPNNEELLQDFFAEAESQVELLESNILALEKNPQDRDAVDEIFRAAHTLKGASATVQMDELASFTHTVEDAFDHIREKRPQIDADLIDLLLSAIDLIKTMLAARSEGEVYHGEAETIGRGINDWLGVSSASELPSRSDGLMRRVPDSVTDTEQPDSPAAVGPSLTAEEREELGEAADGLPVVRVSVGFDESNPMNSVGGIQVFAALKQEASVLKTIPDFDALYEDTYHPVVEYFVATDKEHDVLARAAEISDVTTTIEVAAVDQGEPAGEKRAVIAEESPQAPVARASNATNSSSRSLPLDGKNGASSVENDVDDAASAASPSEGRQDASTADTADDASPTAAGGTTRKSAPSSSILRVDSRRIDDLLNLVSETVINKATFNQLSAEFVDVLSSFQASTDEYRSMLRELFDALPAYLERMQSGASAKEIKRDINERFSGLYSMYDESSSTLRQAVTRFRSNAQNLGRITGELQEGVMRIRMVPISQIFSRFPRLVRDLNRSLGKDVELVIEGEDTELDKSVIEDLLDPLIHCVRNSLDHGIETPEERSGAGKASSGRLVLRAANEGNMIVIQVSDDGRGIDVEAVRQKAIDRGLIHATKALSDVEAFNLIFHPGFSTAKQVSNISGRGVGLDVVKKQIEKLNGTVTVTSTRGSGTHFTIKIPLTLAIIQGLMVRVGKETYAIPITSVVESQRIKPSEIRFLDNHEVLNVREDVISLLRLSRIFRIEAPSNPAHHFVVIVGSGEKKVGLVVDALLGEEDVVIKPLRDKYTNAPGIAGANITGDGRVSLIIDVAQLIEMGLRDEERERRKREAVIGNRD